MSSYRLPGKALASYCPDGATNLAQIIQRWQSSRRSPIVIVATPATPDNDAIADECARQAIPCYRGRNMDALTQMDAALRLFAPNAAIVARALADNPLVDIPLSDWRYDVLCETGADGIEYSEEELKRITYAGTTDVWSRAAWDIIARESIGDEREHAGSYYWNNLWKFSRKRLPLPPREYLRAEIRTELDAPEDLEVMRRVWAAWEEKGQAGSMVNTLWALQWLESHPDVAAINSRVELKTQSKPVVSARGSAWVCPKCRKRTGTVDNGNLIVCCYNCGEPTKFYSHKPAKSPR